MIRRVCFLLIIGCVLGCTKFNRPENGLTGITAEVQLQPSQLIATVIDVLEDNGRSGSLIYRGHCTPSGGIFDSFKVTSPARNVPPIEALRQALAKDPTLTVKEDSSGMIRILDRDAQPDLLGVTIHDVKFQEENDPWGAIYKVLDSPELRTYMLAHHTKFVFSSAGRIPPPSGRHLSGTLTNINVSQSLDRIALTFTGVWFYEECVTGQGEKRVVINFHEFSEPTPSNRYGE